MFGYVLINKEELKFKEYDVYKSYYCGLCQTLNNRSGRFAQLTLNYDMTFLQLLLTGLYEPETKIESFRCKLHPLKKYIKRTNKITDYIADMNLFLAYLNCIDDWEDEKKLSRKIYTIIVKNKVKKIKKQYPEKTAKLEAILKKSSEYEKKKEYDIDIISSYSGELMSELFLYKEDEWKECLSRMGFFLGKYIYIIDAYEDIEKDLKKGNYNPFKDIYKNIAGVSFPQDPHEQLIEAVKAVFRSWNNDRAIYYRHMNDIPSSWGTAVNVQEMVYGNSGETSGTGVAFTRNPATGEKKLFGEYLMNAQGEDVVAGIRTPLPISKLQEQNPAIYKQFIDIVHTLENHYKDMQDMEFTIEEGKLYFLQTRNGKRTAQAALKIAVDLVSEGMLTKEEAILKVEPKQLDSLLHPTFDFTELKNAKVIAKGLPASPGAACGKVAFSAKEAKERAEKGEKVVLVRLETSPEDIEGMIAAEGILTIRGGMTSHAAVVARGMGTCCVAGCGDLKVNEEERTLEANGKVYTSEDYISIDGSTGNVYGEAIKAVTPEISGHFATFMEWADNIRKLSVRTNADNPRDTKQAIEFGAEGIGLCRTEHMFFEEDRIMAMREMIVAKNEDERRAALAKLLPIQKKDFIGMYEALKGMPATIRFLDPPLHEFLPHTDDEIAELAKTMGLSFGELKSTVENLHEFNPMMGHRGCRLDVSYPEIAEMQTRAVIEAAIEVKKSKGYDIVPEIMIPLVGEVKELKFVKDIVVRTAEQVMEESGVKLDYHVGTMIEIPRAALTADEIAKEAEFFSFGTNDLTQMTFGFSRDDAAKFLSDYYERKIYEQDPFAKLDQKGVGQLVKIAVEKGKLTRPNIKLGICGEHGGDPSSVEFCHNIGLNYVSCSPFRVPVARLAAAQAQVKNPRK